MNDREIFISKILNEVAEELNITKTMYEKAITSYNAVGNWIGGMDEKLNIHVSTQGSFSLGTVVRPLSNDDDGYDIDLVCKIEEAIFWDEKTIKNSVGDRLKENRVYKQGMLDKEGKRCWTLSYAGFHMDILPCSPKEKSTTAIRLTHKNDNGIYEPRYSNPHAYRIWFIDRMRTFLKSQISEGIYARAEIEEVPLYNYRTPLQKSIQLLKRHRDIMFENDNDDAPISIIITTLAAKSYDNEEDLYTALKNIVFRMPSFIEYNNGEFEITNPVMAKENFADKWNKNPNKSKSFFEWLKQVQKDIIEDPLSLTGIDEIARPLNKAFGETITKRALNNIGEKFRVERDNSNLYVTGLTGGLSMGPKTENSTKVGRHTFFGKKEDI